jgi:hypothetical protein
MEAGEIVEVGKHADLMAREGVYARLCQSQIFDDRQGAKSRPIEAA